MNSKYIRSVVNILEVAQEMSYNLSEPTKYSNISETFLKEEDQNPKNPQ